MGACAGFNSLACCTPSPIFQPIPCSPILMAGLSAGLLRHSAGRVLLKKKMAL